MVDKTHDDEGRLALVERRTEELLDRLARVEAAVAERPRREGPAWGAERPRRR